MQSNSNNSQVQPTRKWVRSKAFRDKMIKFADRVVAIEKSDSYYNDNLWLFFYQSILDEKE